MGVGAVEQRLDSGLVSLTRSVNKISEASGVDFKPIIETITKQSGAVLKQLDVDVKGLKNAIKEHDIDLKPILTAVSKVDCSSSLARLEAVVKNESSAVNSTLEVTKRIEAKLPSLLSPVQGDIKTMIAEIDGKLGSIQGEVLSALHGCITPLSENISAIRKKPDLNLSPLVDVIARNHQEAKAAWKELNVGFDAQAQYQKAFEETARSMDEQRIGESRGILQECENIRAMLDSIDFTPVLSALSTECAAVSERVEAAQAASLTQLEQESAGILKELCSSQDAAALQTQEVLTAIENTDSQLKESQTKIHDVVALIFAKQPDHLQQVLDALQSFRTLATENQTQTLQEFVDAKQNNNESVLQALKDLDLAVKNADEQNQARINKALDEIGEDILPTGLERVMDGLERQDSLSGTIIAQIKKLSGGDKCDKDIFWTTPMSNW